MRKHVGVIGHNNLRREEGSQGIINIDNDSLNKYKMEREQRLRLQSLFSEHDSMKADIANIKNMLVELLERTQK